MHPSTYYADLTRHYLLYAGYNGFHYGIWENDVHDHAESLIRSNEVMLRRIAVNRSTRVLDIGCGVGAFAVWCTMKYGCHVTGITIVPEHIEMAREHARIKGVGHMCEFLLMDMNALDFPVGSFDLALNQETFCYAENKVDVLRRIRKILTPGGVWTAMEFARSDHNQTIEEYHLYADVLEGFHISHFLSSEDTLTVMRESSFEDIAVTDLTPLTDRSSRHIIRHCYAPLMLERLHIDWIFFSRNPVCRRNHQGHFRAAYAFSRGLLDRVFKYNAYFGRRPH